MVRVLSLLFGSIALFCSEVYRLGEHRARHIAAYR